MTTRKQYDAFYAQEHTQAEKDAFFIHAINNYEPDLHWHMFAGLGVYVTMALVCVALGWAFIYFGIPYVLHIPEVSTPDRVWTVTP